MTVAVPKILTFEKALADADEHTATRSVLLGNGFSIDYDKSIFDYGRLADEATFDGLSVQKDNLFQKLESSNFEVVIEKLKTAANLLRLYGGDNALAKRYEADAKAVRLGLADVVASRHPLKSTVLTDDEVQHAHEFLSNFRHLFTLNYDLLLYWVTNRAMAPPRISKTDGFEWPTVRQGSRLIWKLNPSTPQRVHYLHGALHYFAAEDRKLEKISLRTGSALVPRLRTKLRDGDYPLIVTEGTRAEKEARISRSGYLRTALDRLGRSEGALFIHGMSMSENDGHVLEKLELASSEIKAVYVAVHGGGRRVRKLVDRAEEIRDKRKKAGGASIRLKFYDAASAHVWR